MDSGAFLKEVGEGGGALDLRAPEGAGMLVAQVLLEPQDNGLLDQEGTGQKAGAVTLQLRATPGRALSEQPPSLPRAQCLASPQGA